MTRYVWPALAALAVLLVGLLIALPPLDARYDLFAVGVETE